MAFESSMMTNTGTQAFMAPEMVLKKDFNEKVDEWGAGCILCFLLTGKMPTNGGAVSEDFSSKYEFVSLSNNIKLQWLEDSDKDLLIQLLANSRDDRISARSALIHPWLIC